MESGLHRRRAMTFRWQVALTLVLCTAAGGLVGLFVAQRTPYRFRVSAELLVMPGRESGKMRSDVLFAGGPSGMPKVPSPDFVNGEVALLKSASVLRETVESLGRDIPRFHERTMECTGGGVLSGLATLVDSIATALDLSDDFPVSERSLQEWEECLLVQYAIRTDTVEVSCLVTDSALGEAFLDRLIETYRQAHVTMYTQADLAAMLADEVERLRAAEAEAEAAVRAFRLRTGIIDFDDRMQNLMQSKLAAGARYRGLREAAAATAASAAEIDRVLKDVPERSIKQTVTNQHPTHAYAETRLVASEEKDLELEARYGEAWRPLSRSRESTEIVRTLLEGVPEEREESRVVEGPDPVHTMLSQQRLAATIEQKALASERASARARLAEIEAELVELESLRAEHTELLEELHDVRADLDVALEADQAARMAEVLDEAGIVNVRVISSPKADFRPERQLGRDVRVSVVMGWAGFGLLLSAGFYGLRSAIRDELRAVAPPGGDDVA